jgi:hypothetical protein
MLSLCWCCTFPVLAHDGHNHEHWSAELLRFGFYKYGFYISLCLMIAVWMICIVRILTGDSDNKFTNKT